jgi:putative ABC transport system permease protein
MRHALRLIALLVPADDRHVWRQEWQAEFAYASRHGGVTAGRAATRLAAACRHALWLRAESLSMHTIWPDIRQGVRMLIRRPAFAAATVITLALGIGATTAIYSAARSVLWRPLPYPDPDRLVMISSTTTEAATLAFPNSASPPDFTDWRRAATTFEDVAALNSAGVALTGRGAAEQVSGAVVTGGFFHVLGVPAALGRVLSPADDATGGPDLVVLSYRLWQGRFGGDAAIVGRPIMLDGVAREVVGVMPRGFAFPFDADLWLPLRFTVHDLTTQRGAHYLTVIGRVRQGVGLAVAQAEMIGIATRLSDAYSPTNRGSRASVVSLREALVGDVRPAMRVLLGAVGLVFLVACVNVTSLVLGSAIGRSRDLAVRGALGASRLRLIRGLLVESILLAIAGGLVGTLVATVAVQGIATIQGADIPLLDQTRVDTGVLIFSGVISALAAFLFGAIPAWQASRTDVAIALRSSGTRSTADAGRSRVGSVLVAAEIALAVALLVGAGLLGRTLWSLTRVNLGFDGARVYTCGLSLPDVTYANLARRIAFVDSLTSSLAGQPDVEGASVVFGLPLDGLNYFISALDRDGQRLSEDDQNRLSLQLRLVTPDYFRVMGIRLVDGRSVSASDRRGTPLVVVLNERAARALWPDRSAIGRQITIGTRLGLGGERVGGRVVGVVGDVREFGPAQRARATLYAAYAQFPVDSFSVAVKARQAPTSFVGTLRAAVAAVDPSLPVYHARTMAELTSDIVAQPRLYLELLALFALSAIGLAAIGVYGVIAQNVSARTREIGIRLALGATRREVTAMVVSRAGLLAVSGTILGLGLALAASTAIARLLFGVQPADRVTYALVGAVTVAIALASAWIPARRAARVDPVSALRAE